MLEKHRFVLLLVYAQRKFYIRFINKAAATMQYKSAFDTNLRLDCKQMKPKIFNKNFL